MLEEAKKMWLLWQLLHVVKGVEIMAISAKQAICEDKMPVSRSTRVGMMNEFKDLFHVLCLSILILANLKASTHL
jgi:hypothetical protein